MRVLVTTGATREWLDSVRFFSNISTGKTGCEIADIFTTAGHEVLILCGEASQRPQKSARKMVFSSFLDLDEKLKKILGEESIDLVIHLAAVSDFSIASVIQNGEKISQGVAKIDSSSGSVTVELKPNFKIVDRIKSYARVQEPFVVGFKLTHTLSHEEREKAVEKVLESKRVDWVVHNDVSEMRGPKDHTFTVFDTGSALFRCSTAADLGAWLEKKTRRIL